MRLATPNLAALGLSVLLLAAAPAAAERTESIDETHPFAEGATLELTNTNGSVEIATWDRAEARVEAEKRVRRVSGERARQALEELEVRIQPRDGGLVVETRYPDRRGGLFDWLTGRDVSADVTYRVTLPRRADLEIRSVNGNVKVAGVEGRSRLRTTNGNIEVAESAGRVKAQTTNGGIEVELRAVAPGSDLEFRTTNGGITVYLPEGLGATLVASTTNGTIDTDFPIEVRGRVSSRRLEGTIGGGGPRVELQTTNGRIRIREIGD